ncbi:MAG: TonB family protein [Opitutales bacterium]|nr:TonB family protein [Opitutales bacterium]
MRDNTRLGYYLSVSLHLLIVVAAVLCVLVKTLFKSENREPINPFEMVEPAPETQQAEQPAENVPEIAKQEDFKEIKPIDLPKPEETPPEEAKPEPTPKPEPAPAPKPAPKKVEKPKPQKVSYEEFAKKNPNVANRKVSAPTTRAPTPKIGKISASTSNISNIANITTKSGASAQMRDILGAYVKEIHRKAKANWAVPPTAQNADLATKIEFKVSRTGAISGLRVVVSSGNSEFDASVLSAMRSIALPPPPDNEPHTVYITFTID